MRVSSVILVNIGSLALSSTAAAAASSSTCCCYVKADTENCTEPYMTPSVSSISINPGGISSTLCCEDTNHQIFKSDWCEGSAGKEEQIDACGENQFCIDAINELSQQTSKEYNDHVNDTESLSVAEVDDSAYDNAATNTTSSTNTTCSGESGAPYTSKYNIVTPTICNKEGLCASCRYSGPGSCSCSGTCIDGSIHSDFFALCLTHELEGYSYSYEDCNNNGEPGLCTTVNEGASEEIHTLTADGVDLYFVTSKSCSNSAGVMSSSSSLVLTMLASVITIGVVGML